MPSPFHTYVPYNELQPSEDITWTDFKMLLLKVVITQNVNGQTPEQYIHTIRLTCTSLDTHITKISALADMIGDQITMQSQDVRRTLVYSFQERISRMHMIAMNTMWTKFPEPDEIFRAAYHAASDRS